MNQRQIGIILIIVGIILAGIIYSIKAREDTYINSLIDERGSCFLADGTCLHNRDMLAYTIGWIFSASIFLLGIYLLFFDRTQQKLSEQNLMISDALLETKRLEKEKSGFSAFLSGFSDDEQAVLKAIKEQDGILQSTLRYRTGMSKSTLSLMLNSFEGRGLITKKEAGKTNKVFLRKKF
jgi:DNA-binding MarR family transcriptional regulator